MNKTSIWKRLLSLVLCLCLMVTMVSGLTRKAEAGVAAVLGQAIIKKGVELGIRFACSAASEMVASTANSTDDKIVGSFIQYIIMDGNSATINKIDKTCQKILQELVLLEQDLKEYTTAISTALDRDKIYDAQSQFVRKWEADVDNVLKNNNSLTAPSVQASLDIYVQYLIATYLNINGMPENEAVVTALKNYWNSKYHSELTEASYSATALAQLKTDLETAFLEIYDPVGGLSSQDAAYNSAYIYNFYTATIKQLVDNYLFDNVGANSGSYSVVECAATDAYYLFPFSHQQYQFVNTTAKRQILTVTLLEMALNEYLSMQGAYLKEHSGKESWSTEVPLTYLTNAGATSSITYKQCSQQYSDMVADNLEQAVYLMEADIDINTLAYTGEAKSLTLKLSDYMRPEDAQPVTLTVEGHTASHDYYPELSKNGFTAWEIGYPDNSNITSQNNIPATMTFHRVMSGNSAQKVYYILDPNQFDGTLEVSSLGYHMKRTGHYGLSDWAYGDLYVASADYLNLLKPMSDNTNRFAVPRDLNTELTPLFNTPIFSAKYGFNPSQYLQQYWGTGSNLYLVSANYDNRLVDGGIGVRSGLVHLGKASEATTNSYDLTINNLKFQNILSENPGQYTAILANTADTYQQSLSLKVNEESGPVEDAYIAYGDSRLAVGETKTLTSSEVFTVRFKLSDNQSASLTMVRKNATQVSSVLLDGDDLNLLECDEDGYYSFTTTMPHSPIDIIITTSQKQASPEEPTDPPVKHAFATIERFTAPYLVEQFRLEYNGLILQNEGEAMEVICGDPMDLVIDMKSYAYLDRVSMITDGVATTLFNQENYKDILTDRGDGTFALTVTMPEKDTTFAIYTVSEDCPTLTLTRNDPREAIYQFNAAVGEYYVSSEPVPAGSEITLNIFLKGANAFHELTMVTGGERTVLLDKQTFVENASGSNSYSLTVVMPSSDTEIILSTLPIGETYEPTDNLQINEEGSFLIYTYDDLRSMAYFINNNAIFYTDEFYIPYIDGHYILMNDIDVENRELETISKDPNNPFSGSFEGNGYTISNYTILADSIYNNGLFGFVDGEIRNLKLAGQYTVRNTSTKDKAYPCTLAYKISGNGSVSNVQTQVTLALDGFTSAPYISGIAYSVEPGCVIDRCLVRDTVNLPDIPITAYAGIFNSTLSYKDYSISNCGVVSTVNVKSCDNAYGLFGGGSMSTYNAHNCYSACTFTGDITNRYALFNANARTVNATNCYYLDTLPQNGNLGTAATLERFNSGEIAYLLQGQVKQTDAEGNQLQIWGQNIDGEGEKELYPVFSDDRVYYKIMSGCCQDNFVYSYTNFDRDNIAHDYKADYKPATCTEDGYTKYDCSNCGDSYTDPIPAIGHRFYDIVEIVDSTCTTDGTITYACTVCGETCVETIDATDHSYVETARAEPTCTEDGSVTYTCEYCGDSYTETTPATGHDYGDDNTCDNCGDETPAIELLYPTLTFKDEVSYNIYFKVHGLKDISTENMGLILFDSFLPEGTMEDAIEIISGAQDASVGYKVSTHGIPAKKMGDDIHFRIYIRMTNGEYLYTPTLTYSAVDYARNILAGNYSQAQKDIVVAMLEYGVQAQLYFSYKTDSLMNANLTQEQLSSIESYRSDMMNTVAVPDSTKTQNFAATGGFDYLYPSVNFTGAFAINYYCAPTNTPVGEVTLYYWSQSDCNAADVLTTDNATAAIPMVLTDDGYVAAVEGIAAKDLDRGVYIAMVYSDGATTHSSGVISYSIGTYCQSHAAQDNAFSPLAAACAVYSYYAKVLFYIPAA